MKKTELILKTLTPLWTGGIDTTVADRLHETGIIGSLRWWYEAILRGCGVEICDPTTQSCAGCAACQAYGMTGQRRNWKFTITEDFHRAWKPRKLNNSKPDTIHLPSGRIHGTRSGGWHYGNGFVGDLKFDALPLSAKAASSTWELPLYLAAIWGGLGPKTQSGYGVVDVCELGGKQATPNVDRLLKDLPTGEGDYSALPDLRDFFFAILEFKASGDWWKQVKHIDLALAQAVSENGQTVRLDNISAQLQALADDGCVLTAPAFRNWLRFDGVLEKKTSTVIPRATPGNEDAAAIELFGQVRGDNRRRSRIHVSSAYLTAGDIWEIRIWGWVPESKAKNYERDRVLGSLADLLNDPARWSGLLGSGITDAYLAQWKEFNPNQDTMESYLKSLLGGATS